MKIAFIQLFIYLLLLFFLKGVIGTFEWIDGSLIQALIKGEWVLLDNVNLCHPTVLYRLNSLLEHNGFLLLNECGLVNQKVLFFVFCFLFFVFCFCFCFCFWFVLFLFLFLF